MNPEDALAIVQNTGADQIHGSFRQSRRAAGPFGAHRPVDSDVIRRMRMTLETF